MRRAVDTSRNTCLLCACCPPPPFCDRKTQSSEPATAVGVGAYLLACRVPVKARIDPDTAVGELMEQEQASATLGLCSRCNGMRIAVSHKATHRARGGAIMADLNSLQPALAAASAMAALQLCTYEFKLRTRCKLRAASDYTRKEASRLPPDCVLELQRPIDPNSNLIRGHTPVPVPVESRVEDREDVLRRCPDKEIIGY